LPEILNIGFDLEEVQRFEKYIQNIHEWDVLLHDVFSPEEIKRNNAHIHPAACYTLCFCFKEALSKALGKSWMNAGLDWKEMELLLDTDQGFETFHTHLSGEALRYFEGAEGCKLECEPGCDLLLASCKVMILK